MAVYKVPTDILEACKKELEILSSKFGEDRVGKYKDFNSYIKRKVKSKIRARKLIKLLEDNYGV